MAPALVSTKTKKTSRTSRTTMRLTITVMKAARDKAARLGLSRTQYVEALVRKDLGLEAIETNVQSASIFG